VGQRAKTDALDAAVLARSAEAIRPPVWAMPDADAQKLQALLARRGQLVQMRTMEKNRLAGLTVARVRRGVRNVLRTLGREIRDADRELGDAIRACPAKDDLLQSIPGIGPTVSRTLLLEMPGLGTLTRGEAAALAGVAPLNRESGTFRGKRVIAGGRAVVRSMLYLAAHAARQGNAVLRAFADRLRAAGKPPKVVRIALARKLLLLANAVLRDNTAWMLKT
jgi:transposase